MKIYISCYENSDSKYKEDLIKFNNDRNQNLFELIPGSESDLYKINRLDGYKFIDGVKRHVLKNADVVVFLIGLETHKRMSVDWEARAAMHNTSVLRKCGIIVVYLPDVVEKYGNKIPRSILPKIIQKNIMNPDASILETTWQKIVYDINGIDQILSVGFAYGQMSKYIDDYKILRKNSTYASLK